MESIMKYRDAAAIGKTREHHEPDLPAPARTLFAWSFLTGDGQRAIRPSRSSKFAGAKKRIGGAFVNESTET